MKILSFVSQYGPDTRSSGPAESMRGVAAALEGLADLSIVTPEPRRRTAAQPAPPGWCRESDHRRWMTMKRGPLMAGRIARLIHREKPDIVYLNSFFDLNSTIFPLLWSRFKVGKRPVVILAARGELAPKALEISARKKAIVLWAARLLGLHRGTIFQAGGQLEMDHISKIFPDNKVQSTFDIGQLPDGPAQERARGNDNALRLLFLSRITPMKNLHIAIEALRQCTEPVHLSIYGPNRDEKYYLQCRQLEQDLPEHVQLSWHGAVDRERVIDVMRQHDLFILPTSGEGFGHVIHEALCAGTPVLISDRTNWDEHLPDGLSWVVPLRSGAAGFRAVIDMMAGESVGQRQRRSAALLAANPALKARQDAISQTRQMFIAAAS